MFMQFSVMVPRAPRDVEEALSCSADIRVVQHLHFVERSVRWPRWRILTVTGRSSMRLSCTRRAYAAGLAFRLHFSARDGANMTLKTVHEVP